MIKRHFFAPAVSLASMFSIAACGGGSSEPKISIPAGAVVVLAKDGNKFDEASYSGTAGEVTLAYDGQSSIAHTLLLLGEDGKQIGEKLRVSSGQVEIGTYTLAAGTYQVICDVPGHDAMKATLVIS